MATINRPRKKKEYKEKGETQEHIHKLVYNTAMWRRIKESVLMVHPLCQNCLKNLATEVHHVTPLTTAKDDEELLTLGFDSGNLMAVCTECHHQIHQHK